MSERRRSRGRRVIVLIAVVLFGAILIPGGVTQSTTVVSCARTALDLSRTVHCVATVFGFSPTGTVMFSAGGKGQVAFAPQWCSLTAGTCEVVANGTVPGVVLTNASYLGDANNYDSAVGNVFNIYGGYISTGPSSVPLEFLGGGRALTIYTPLLPPAIAVFPENALLGKAVRLSLISAFAGGTPPYTCAWSRLAPNASEFSRIGAPFACTRASARPVSTGPLNKEGVWLFELQVTDSSDEGPPTTVASNLVGVQVLAPAAFPHAFSISCQPSRVLLHVRSPLTPLPSTKCRATVIGNLPVGSVRWASDTAGSFPLSVCHLVDGTCYVTFFPHSTGSPVTITAVYNGNSRNPSLNATTSFTVGKAYSHTSVMCSPASADPSVKIRCFAIVSGYRVSGSVAWTERGTGNASLFSPTCALANGVCSVVLSGVKPGMVSVHAAYSGNDLNGASAGVAAITIRKIGS